MKEAQPHRGGGEGMRDETIGISLPGESLREKCERSHMEKMASAIPSSSYLTPRERSWWPTPPPSQEANRGRGATCMSRWEEVQGPEP